MTLRNNPQVKYYIQLAGRWLGHVSCRVSGEFVRNSMFESIA